MGQRTFEFVTDGVAARATYEASTVELLRGLVERWSGVRAAAGSRTIVLLAAPPGAGKTTLARTLEQLGEGELQALPLDGFHHSNSYLAAHATAEGRPLASIKGAPETFDLPTIAAKLAELRDAPSGADVAWPLYDRTIHDPRPDAIAVTASIVLVEGNWLLLDEPGWRDLATLADDTVFLSAEEALLRERLVVRKMRGGLDRAAAETWFDQVDGPNIRRVLAHRMPASSELVLADAGTPVRISEEGRGR